MSEATPQVQASQVPEPSPVVAVSPGRLAVVVGPLVRIWPAVFIVVVQWLLIIVPQWIWPGERKQLNLMLAGAVGGAVAIALWWLFANRMRWADRVSVVLFFIATGVLAFPLYHPTFTIRNYGPVVRGLPLATTFLVVWLAFTRNVRWPARRIGVYLAIVLAWCYCMCLRIDGVDGSFAPDVRYRWSPTAEERFLVELNKSQAAPATTSAESSGTPLQLQPGDWPGFRGANRDSRLTGVQIATDWKTNPPRQLWKHGIGPGWSSFCVLGERLYTQEQRGQDEVVVCYDAATGKQLWSHGDDARFFETIGGTGPRATPTFADGKLFTLGAMGNLNCLDPVTGKVLWSQNILTDSGRDQPPQWGFSSSPLVVGGIVMVFAGGPDGKSVLGYRAANGELAWAAGQGKDSYSSAHLAKLGGVEQALLASDAGLTSFVPANGQVLWHYGWSENQVAFVAQPALLSDSEVLFGKPGQEIRRLRVALEGSTWGEPKEEWSSKAIKPYYNDLVLYKDYIYGFDNNFLTCVSLADGKSRWKQRGYGNGQALLLADQGLLLVSSEKGQVCLVEAKPDYRELARFQAIEGKTWNHPVVAHGKLFIRNGEEMACFQLTESSSDVLQSASARGK